MIILDRKDLARLDAELAAESCVWSVLLDGAKGVSEADFVGASEVRVAKMSGFGASDYVRGADNARKAVRVEKETCKLAFERWMAYDLDALDQSESAGYDVANVVEQHVRLVVVPEKDRAAAKRLLENAGKTVDEALDETNALAAYDAAEEYMTESGVAGPFVMLCSSEYYRALKNSQGVEATFSYGQANLGGIDRRVGLLDGEVPVVRVAADRLQQAAGKSVNFILLPQSAAAPIEKYNDVTLVGADADRDGYRDTVKGMNYYDLIVLDNAKKGIYVSWKDA